MNSKTRNVLLGIILTIAIIACSFTIITTISKSSNDEVVYADTNWTGDGSGTKMLWTQKVGLNSIN